MKFKEILESKNIIIDVSDLQDVYSDGEQEFDDFHYFLKELKQYGLKDRDWTYAGDNIVIPGKYEKYIKPWNVNIV